MAALKCAAAPCKSCPYRRDVPSGVWAEEEYAKLPAYDGEPFLQLIKGGASIFLCHQQDGKLCAGWVGCHGGGNLVALRLQALVGAAVDPSVWAYESPVPLFGSGREAAAHGRKGIRRPGKAAKRMVSVLQRKLERTGK